MWKNHERPFQEIFLGKPQFFRISTFTLGYPPRYWELQPPQPTVTTERMDLLRGSTTKRCQSLQKDGIFHMEQRRKKTEWRNPHFLRYAQNSIQD
jgi:hypothetical protein